MPPKSFILKVESMEVRFKGNGRNEKGSMMENIFQADKGTQRIEYSYDMESLVVDIEKLVPVREFYDGRNVFIYNRCE